VRFAPKLSRASRAWYAASIADFTESSSHAVLGQIAANSGYDITTAQRNAWLEEIGFLQQHLARITGAVFLEFSIPRMGRRIDAVVLVGPVVFVIEFKVGALDFTQAHYEQVWDYALDLKNFHAGSHDAEIVPILLATEAASAPAPSFVRDPDGVYRPIVVTRSSFARAIAAAMDRANGVAIDPHAWLASPYRPTPTIIEAARALYAEHSVEAIARSDAGAENLRVTSGHLEELVAEAQKKKRKLICFVTGVPGAGKTLVGLNLATREREGESTPAVYLSGNAPLVAVLRAALTRDKHARTKAEGGDARKGKIAEEVKQFIQNVHHFRDDAIADAVNPPAEHVAIFDEAQRAWTREQTASFMLRKKGHANFDQSEPEFLVSYMDRHRDWAVVVCLVGGGQEINVGEAGIASWLEAAETKFSDWRMHISSRLLDREYAAGEAVKRARARPNTTLDDCLHLAVSMRSFRAEHVSSFVKAVLDREIHTARDTFEQLRERYPIVMTRDLDAAKEWVRDRARGSERYGLVASSKAQRLKPHAIDVRVDVDPVHWFLSGKDDTRSSYYLEDAATEFQVQGLELDWSVVTWDADLRSQRDGWGFHDFKGNRWENVRKEERQRYLLNAYRVLLTRARQGMAIFVPPGSARDATREPGFYEGTWGWLRECGVEVVG
jgi:hypothetical protein